MQVGKCKYGLTLHGRKNYSEDGKEAVPVVANVGDRVTYTIEVTNNSEYNGILYYTLNDVMPENLNLLKYNTFSSNLYQSNPNENLYSYRDTIAINYKETQTYVIECVVTENKNLDKYKNTANICKVYSDSGGKNELKNKSTKTSSSDYFCLLQQSNISINKYISAVNGETPNAKMGPERIEAHSRDSFTNKKDFPVVVEVGDKVTYTIEVTNNSEYNASLYYDLKDVMPDNVELIMDYTFAKKAEQDEDNPNIYEYKNISIAPNKKQSFIINCIVTKDTSEVGVMSDYENTAIISAVYSDSGGKNELDNISTQTSSSDYFCCKQYRVGLKNYISKVTMPGGGDITAGEKLSTSLKYYPNDNGTTNTSQYNRSEIYSGEYKNNPVYIENGDRIYYTVFVQNHSLNSNPCFTPKPVDVELTIKLPNDAKYVDGSISGGTRLNDSTETNLKIKVENLASAENREVKIALYSNVDPEKTIDYDILNKISSEITNVINVNGKTTSASEIKTTWVNSIDNDYYRIKEYNIGVDLFIRKVEHNSARANKTGTAVTYNAQTRKNKINVSTGKSDRDNENDPVYVEYGDRVYYDFYIYNTTDNEYYNVERDSEPYQQPNGIEYFEYTITCSGETSSFKLGSRNQSPGKTFSNFIQSNNFRYGNGNFVVENSEKDSTYTIDISIDNNSFINRNHFKVINNSKRTAAKDAYKINDYSALLEQYVTVYNAEMAIYNNSNGFTSGEYEGFSVYRGDSSKTYSSTNNPLDIEKYETIQLTTSIENVAKTNEAEGDATSYKKYNTRVRPSQVNIDITKGFQYSGENINIWKYKEDGTVERDREAEGTVTHTINDGIITYSCGDEVILGPNDYMIIDVILKASESNEYLDLLKTTSEIAKLTNINNNKSSNIDRNVTTQNTIQQVKQSNYFRMKDPIIAGKVWIDSNRNGLKDNGENPKPDTEVILYKIVGDDSQVVASTKTDANGFYSFGRQFKSSRKNANGNYTSNDYVKYFVEFKYNGLKYKATEIYGGDDDGNADGMHNLGGKAGSKGWRQGYSDLPDARYGDSNYMIDSNAYEFSNIRKNLNQEYQSIGFNKSYVNARAVNDMSYTKNNHISELNEDTSVHEMTARSFITQNYTTNDDDFTSESLENTNTVPLVDYAGFSNSQPETEYMKYINLGLVTRESVNVSLDGDVDSVETTINGEKFKYEFDKNTVNSSEDNYGSVANSYKFDEAYKLELQNSDYNYRYDTYYTSDDNLKDYKGVESELEAKVNYTITLRNKQITNDETTNNGTSRDIPIEVAVNEVAIYYDENFISAETIKDITTKTKNSDTGLFENSSEKSLKVMYAGRDITEYLRTTSLYGSSLPSDLKAKGYNVMYLRNLSSVYIKEGQSQDINISFYVDKDKIEGLDRSLKINDTKENNMGLELIAEITSYRTRYGSNYENKLFAGKYAGLVDSNSNPGNLGIDGNSVEGYDQYEDDTYKVGIKLLLKNDPSNINPPGGDSNNSSNSRTITGFVWDDTRSTSVGTGESEVQYLGNGKYSSSDTINPNAKVNPYNSSVLTDKPISGVKVTLMELSQKANEEYYEKPAKYTYDVKDSSGNIIHRKGDEIVSITDENGKYTLTDFIPGYYIVRFDYGYDSNNIIYNGQDYKSTEYGNAKDYYSSGKGYKKDFIGSEDNFGYFNNVKTLLKISNLSDAADDEIRRLLVNSYSETMTTNQAQVFSELNNFKTTLVNNTAMYAETSIFYVKSEDVLSEVMSEDIDNVKDTYWNIEGIDFGLEYRPEALIELSKNIDNLEIITSDNKTLVKLYFKQDGDNWVIDEDKSIGYKDTQFLSNDYSTKKQGFLNINMDTNILEGARVNVKYKLNAENSGEVDRINPNLDKIKFMKGAKENIVSSYWTEVDDNYSANASAASVLSTNYYELMSNSEELSSLENYKYLKKIKKPYSYSSNTSFTGWKNRITGTGYYGMFLGTTYYKHEINNDVISGLKVNNILDCVDNDFTFRAEDNSNKNNMWTTTTSSKLLNGILDKNKVKTNGEYLVDRNNVQYDTDSRSNLVLSVDSNESGYNENTGNESLSRFLVPKNGDNSYAEIELNAGKIFSAEDLKEGKSLQYENIAEVVEYTNLTGRRTTLPNGADGGEVIGNANVESWTGYKKDSSKYIEDDTDATEVITITPPTGLTK